MTGTTDILHASSVAVDGRGLLILGPSGSGKSALALRLISLGAVLIADDRTLVERHGDSLQARCPSTTIRGLIEARGVGILRADSLESVTLTHAVDLSHPETERLPPFRTVTILGVSLPLVLHPQKDHFPDALMLYLRHGRQA